MRIRAVAAAADNEDDWVELPDEIDAKKLDSKDRKALGGDQFAVPGKRKLPINDANHVRNALARFNQTKGLTPVERSAARAKINRAAKKHGVKVDAKGDEEMTVPATMRIEAMSLDLPVVDGHPNRMPFSGILTRIDVASDKPPHGSNGKRILLTRAAAETALPSLLGMGVDLKRDMDGHDAQNKVGVITAAHIDGDALNIEGFIYAADFPREALRIHLDKANLGFSFEASNLKFDATAADPLVINGCMFTGAAILLKSEAAYQTTALAAAKAKEHEMDDLNQALGAALPDLIAKALEPMTKAITDISAAQAAQAAVLEEIKKSPAILTIEANAAMCARVEPHAAGLEAAADGMEKDGIGVAPTSGHTHHLRRMASAMRGDAARGKLPHEYHDSGAYWAAGDPQHQQQQQAPKPTEDDDMAVKDAPEFKALQAAHDAQAEVIRKQEEALQKQADAIASLETKFTDQTAKIQAMREPPTRKTISPEIGTLLARHGLSAPEDGGTIPIQRIDAALATMPDMTTSQRMYLKTTLQKAGVVGFQ